LITRRRYLLTQIRGFGEEARRSHEETFTSHADALRYLEENLDEPLTGRAS
jgi:hypothetical protein